MSKKRNSLARWTTGSLTAISLLTVAIGLARALTSSSSPIFAEIAIEPQALKAASGLEPDYDFDVSREANFITGPIVLEAALKRPEVARLETVKQLGAHVVVRLGQRIRVEFPTTNVLRIIDSGERTFESVTLVNGIAEAYIDEVTAETARLRAERISLLERARRDAEHRLVEKRDAIRRFKKLLETTESGAGPDENRAGDQVLDWKQDLAKLKIAIEQGEEMVARITAELPQLQNAARVSGVELRRRAEL